MTRTPKQKAANELDREIYRLYGHAQELKLGFDTLRKFREIRSDVRRLMHPDDRKGTEG